MKSRIVLLFAVSVAVCLFIGFRVSGLEEIKAVSAVVGLYHCKHFVSVVVGLVKKIMEV